MSGLSFRPGQ
jgi:hypothetical protein